MGFGFYSTDSYNTLRNTYMGKNTDDIFTNTKTNTIANEMDPKNLSIRECRDSIDHTNTIPIMFLLDVTGSMGAIPEIIIREKLDHLMTTLIDNGVKDAQIMFSAIGDHHSDMYPIQVGQFESETEKLNHWLSSINLEGGGGGQNCESYLLGWLIAGRHTSIDSFEKRNQKGFLFTVGDEKSWNKISSNSLKSLMGYTETSDVTDKQLLQEAQRMYEVFHIHVQQGSYRDNKEVLNYWHDLLNERLLKLEDYNNICELIATTVSTILGANIDDVISKMSSDTALMIKNTISPVLKNTNLVTNDSIIEF